MERKKYYWLKLRDDFFTSKRIKKLRNMAGGDTYVIIYLKMQLLAMKTDGILRWTGLEDKFADELALDLDEKPDDVEVTLMYLLRTGLAETSDNINFFLPYAVENTGKESSSAERVRAFREREKQKRITGLTEEKPARSNAEQQRAFRAKQNAQSKQHIPMIEDYINQKRYGGNYYLVCQREKFRCAICESTENLCVHHIDGYDESKPENNATNKMILLCRDCHSHVHAGVSIPQEVLDSICYDRNVTCNTDVTACNTEKEIEIEIDKEKESDIEKESMKRKRFSAPTVEEVAAYCRERGNAVDPQHFVDYYTSNGWKVGKNPMKDWKAAVRTWERSDAEKRKKSAPGEKKILTFMDL